MKYFRDSLGGIDSSHRQAVPASHVRIMIMGMLTMISKTSKTINLITNQDALSIMHIEAREIAKETAKTMGTATAGLRNNAAEIKRSITIGEGISEVSNKEGYREEEESCGQNTSHRLAGRMGR
jgi:hypothetical protein